MTSTTPLRPIPQFVPLAPRKCHRRIKEFLQLQRRDKLIQECVLTGLFQQREECVTDLDTTAASLATQTVLFRQTAHLDSTVNILPVSADPSCSICLDTFELNHPLVEAQCGHIFHKECQEKWSSLAKTCAYCRQTVHLVKVLSGHGHHDGRLEIKIERLNVPAGNGRLRRKIKIKFTETYSCFDSMFFINCLTSGRATATN